MVTVCRMLVLRAFSWSNNSFYLLGICQELHLILTDILDSINYRYSKWLLLREVNYAQGHMLVSKSCKSWHFTHADVTGSVSQPKALLPLPVKKRGQSCHATSCWPSTSLCPSLLAEEQDSIMVKSKDSAQVSHSLALKSWASSLAFLCLPFSISG